MLILCSNGLSSQIRTSIQSIVQDAKKAALVVTADHIYKENNYHVERCKNELVQFGIVAETFDLDFQSPELLLDYDIVEFIGGNPFYLLNSIREHNAETILRKIADQKILIGWSAALFVFGPTLELVNLYSPELNFLNLQDLNGLLLTEIEALPHYSKFIRRINCFEEICAEYERIRKKHVIRLNDGDDIIITNDKKVKFCYA